ncbi:substrate-binding periplasmic protein [Agarivorans sp. QJM3NY_29]|uniref:substrate-binding periplasmic protein n=1 Tax=unclassified Agarivorans TaxID=2636026 RepID=UPI003D7DCB2F
MRILLILLCCWWSVSLAAVHSINIATGEWTNYAHRDGTGYYFSLLQRIFPDTSISPHFVPFPRSIALLDHQLVDIALGGSSDDFSSAYCSLYAVEVDRVDMLTTSQFAGSYQSNQDLVGKKVISRLGYNWGELLPRGVVYREYSNLVQMLNLLNLGRVGAVIEYREDIELLLTKMPKPSNFIFIDSVLENNSQFCFVANEKGRDLLKLFDLGMSQLIANGELRQLMIELLGSDENYPY